MPFMDFVVGIYVNPTIPNFVYPHLLVIPYTLYLIPYTLSPKPYTLSPPGRAEKIPTESALNTPTDVF